MNQIKLMCRHQDKTHRKIIQAKHEKKWYYKKCPRTLYVLSEDWVGVHPVMLDQIARDIAFMDRTDLISSGSGSPILGLRHKYSSPYGEWGFNPYCHRGGENQARFDHTTAWRKKGDLFPKLVITEPYGFSYKNREYCDDICENSGYRYRAFPPSNMSLWNDNCYMIFWWHSEFYEPDFDILLQESNNEVVKETNE
tara:strand:+ start:335 stop:922 length:588 start_codon:yes stop_codon:yes gene_type:complete